MLAFTIKLRGNQMSDFLSASVPGYMQAASNTFGPPEARYQTGSSYNWQWADVTWFLQPQFDANGNPDTTVTDPSTGTAGVQLYTLYRNQRLAVPDNSLVPTQTFNSLPAYLLLQGQYAEVSSWPSQLSPPAGNLYFNSPIDLTVPSRRFGMIPPNLNIQGTTVTANPAGMLLATTYPPSFWLNLPTGVGGTWLLPGNGTLSYPTLAQLGAGGTLAGADIQLTNVVSFDVRLLVQGVSNSSNANEPFVTLWQAPFTTPVTTPGGMNNYNPAFYPTPGRPMVFDTWTSVNDSLTQGYYSTWNLPGPGVPPPPPGTPPPPTNTFPPSSPGGLTPGLTSIPLWNLKTQQGPIIQALQITIRIWDQKTNQTRQVTIVQAM